MGADEVLCSRKGGVWSMDYVTVEGMQNVGKLRNRSTAFQSTVMEGLLNKFAVLGVYCSSVNSTLYLPLEAERKLSIRPLVA